MKQTFFFLIVLTICGSLTKAPAVLRCGTQIKSTSYLKGKIVHIDTITTFATTYRYMRGFGCNLHKKPMTFFRR